MWWPWQEVIARKGLQSPYEEIIRAFTDDSPELIALVKAVIAQESGWNPDAINPLEPGASASYGLMQIRYPGGPTLPGGRRYPDDLMADVQLNLAVGIDYLRYQLSRYGDMEDAISAYNGGSALRLLGGGYRNQAYVDAVNTYFVWYVNHQEATTPEEQGVVDVWLSVLGVGSPPEASTVEATPGDAAGAMLGWGALALAALGAAAILGDR